MSSPNSSRVNTISAYAVVIACVGLLLLGALMYGVSLEVHQRAQQRLLENSAIAGARRGPSADSM